MEARINETDSSCYAYNGLGNWIASDIVFGAARFKEGERFEKAMVTSNLEVRCLTGSV
jgi:hypothetical protein